MTERTRWIGFAGLCALALALLVGAYANSFGNSFHFDDSHVIESNLYIRDLGNVPLFFRDATTFSALPQNSIYRPLVSATLALDYWLGGGLDVWQFHLTQLVLLAALGVAVFFLARRLFAEGRARPGNRLAALLAATVFALHVTNTDTMNQITVRSELLSTLGVVGSFLVYFRGGRARRFHLYLLPMVIGALAKTPSVMFAPLLLAWVLLFEQRLSLREVLSRRAWPQVRGAVRTCLPALVVGAVTFAMVESRNAAGSFYGGGDRLPYLVTQSFVWLHYARLFFLPVALTADTDWVALPWYDTRVAAGVLFLAVLARLAWTASRTPAGRPVAFGIAWFAIALLPTSSIESLSEITNGHRMLFPYVGAALAVVWAAALGVDALTARAARLSPRAGLRRALLPAAWVAALAIVGGLACGVRARNTVWLSEETLWRDVVAKSPANGRGYMNYGVALMTRGRCAEAKPLLERALVLNPDYGTLEVNLGLVNAELGDDEAASRHFQRALQLAPDAHVSHFYLARWLAGRGRLNEAAGHLERALALSPADISTRYLLLDVDRRLGRSEDVARLAQDTLLLIPDDTVVQQYLPHRGEPGVAHALDASPAGRVAALLGDSLRLYAAGRFQDSIDSSRHVLELDPRSAEAANNVSAASSALGRWDDAIAAAQQALALKPDFELARNNLAWAQSGKRKQEQAPGAR